MTIQLPDPDGEITFLNDNGTLTDEPGYTKETVERLLATKTPMKQKRKYRRDPRRIGIPPVSVRCAAVRLGVSLLHARRAFEDRLFKPCPSTLRRAEDGWSYKDPLTNRDWTYWLDGILYQAGRKKK